MSHVNASVTTTATISSSGSISSPLPSPSPTPMPLPSPVWRTNFEISSLSQLGISYGTDNNGSQNDTVSLSTEQAHSGNQSLKATTDDGRMEFYITPGSLIQNCFYFNWWVYIPSNMVPTGTGSSQWLTIFQLEGSVLPRYEPIAKLQMMPPNGTITTLVWEDVNGSQTTLATGPALIYDQWINIQWYTYIGTNGTLEAWMNGAQMWDVTNFDTSALNQATLYFMTDIYGMNGFTYADDMALYNVNMNGVAPYLP